MTSKSSDFNQKLASFEARMILREAAITNNPWPYIKDLERQLVMLSKCLERIEDAVHPMARVEEEGSKIQDYKTLEAEQYERLSKITDIIDNYHKERHLGNAKSSWFKNSSHVDSSC